MNDNGRIMKIFEMGDIDGITKYLPSYAGLALQLEIDMLEKVLKNSEPVFEWIIP